MGFGYSESSENTSGEFEMTFSGEELGLVMEAFRAAVPVEDPLGEKILLRYLSAKVAFDEKKEEEKPKMGFLR